MGIRDLKHRPTIKFLDDYGVPKMKNPPPPPVKKVKCHYCPKTVPVQLAWVQWIKSNGSPKRNFFCSEKCRETYINQCQ